MRIDVERMLACLPDNLRAAEALMRRRRSAANSALENSSIQIAGTQISSFGMACSRLSVKSVLSPSRYHASATEQSSTSAGGR
jgi:hypothetical protein